MFENPENPETPVFCQQLKEEDIQWINAWKQPSHKNTKNAQNYSCTKK